MVQNLHKGDGVWAEIRRSLGVGIVLVQAFLVVQTCTIPRLKDENMTQDRTPKPSLTLEMSPGPLNNLVHLCFIVEGLQTRAQKCRVAFLAYELVGSRTKSWKVDDDVCGSQVLHSGPRYDKH